MKLRNAMSSLARLFLLVGALCISAPSFAADAPLSLPGAKTVSLEEVKGMVGKIAIFDVRKKASYLEGHLPTGQSITHAQDKATKKFDPAVFGADKAAMIIIHGHGPDGQSAVMAVSSAVEAGYTNVLWFRGGVREWTDGGNALVN